MSNNIDVKQKAMSGGAFAPPLMLSVALGASAHSLYQSAPKAAGGTAAFGAKLY